VMILKAGLLCSALVVVVASTACSSTGSKSSDPTTVRSTFVPASAVGLGTCPAQLPLSLPKSNVRVPVARLAKSLVPIEASDLRVCEYTTSLIHGDNRVTIQSQLVSSGSVGSPEAGRFENRTNRLPDYNGEPGPPEPDTFTTFLLTFGNAHQRASIEYAVDVAPLTNEVLEAIPTPQWKAELHSYRTN
jgi:hypothetical protein